MARRRVDVKDQCDECSIVNMENHEVKITDQTHQRRFNERENRRAKRRAARKSDLDFEHDGLSSDDDDETDAFEMKRSES